MAKEVVYYTVPNLYDGDGIFTVITSTFIYERLVRGMSSLAIQSLIPWDKIIIPVVYNLTPVFDAFTSLEGLGCRFNLHHVDSPPASGYEDKRFYLNDTHTRWITQRIRRTTNFTSWFEDSSHDYDISSNYLPLGTFHYNGDSVWDAYILVTDDDMSRSKVFSISREANGTVTFAYVGAGYFEDKGSTAANYFNPLTPAFVPSSDPYEDAGGGEGALPDSETIGMPSEPTLTPIDTGLFSLYSPTATQMRNLADFLWTDFGGSGTTVEQVLEEVVEALKRSVSNPLNSMLGLSIIASQGLSKGSDSSVHVGFWNTGVSMTKLTKQYFNVDCGSLNFNPVCGNTFLDYAPYSKFMIFLPYVGMRILDANDVVGHTISIKYRGDCVSGALTCYVIRDNSVIQEYTGNCALNIPLTADSWAETISGVAQLISGTVSGAAMGGTGAAAAAGAIKSAASVATNPSAFSPQVAHTGAVSGAAGHLGSQKPFILREAVRFHSTGNFNSIIGYPSYYYRKLGDCHGYTQCLEVHLSHTPCTGVELQEIEDLLKKGVII